MISTSLTLLRTLHNSTIYQLTMAFEGIDPIASKPLCPEGDGNGKLTRMSEPWQPPWTDRGPNRSPLTPQSSVGLATHFLYLKCNKVLRRLVPVALVRPLEAVGPSGYLLDYKHFRSQLSNGKLTHIHLLFIQRLTL